MNTYIARSLSSRQPLTRALRLLVVVLVSLVVLSGSQVIASGSGNSLDFDGTDDYVNVGNDASFNVGNTLTIEAWVKPANLSNRYGIFSTRLNNTANAFQLEIGIGSGGTNRVAVTGLGNYVAQTGDGALNPNEWTHIAYVRNGTGDTHAIYVNGVEQTLSTAAYTFADNSSDKVIASGTNGGQLYPGQIDEVRVWNVARTGTEIRENIHLTLSGTETGLVAYYQFDHTSGTDLDDLTANNNDGTLLGSMTDDDWVASTAPLDIDFGDAPAPYPTLFSDNGPYHSDEGPTLGAARDIDVDGQPTAGADGDDNNGTDDEDGVSGWTNIQTGALGASVTVNVQGGPAVLDAWVDWNRDGAWGGPFEQIAEGLDVSVGDNIVTFDVPSRADAGDSYARFRLSSAGGLGVGGFASDGEVEDHLVGIASPATGSRYFYPAKDAGSADTVKSIFPTDVDGDGDMDVLSASSDDDTIAWYENDGSQNFTSHTITTSADNAQSVFAADMDGDGDMDALSASYDNGTIAWYENDGLGNFTTNTITTSDVRVWSVFAADMDGDGDMDVISAAERYNDDSITWYENDGGQNFTPYTITTPSARSFRVFAADVDSDGDMDIASASDIGYALAWYENDGNQNFTTHPLTTTSTSTGDIFVADLDSDGDMDILRADDSQANIYWYENDGAQNFDEHLVLVTNEYGWPAAVFAADMDGDGDMDVLSIASFSRYGIVWGENDGSQNFTKRVIATGSGTGRDVFAADADGDGDMDVFTAHGDEVTWYEQGEIDLGDAPAPYPVLLAGNGPRHGVGGPTLGATRDYETDGQPSAGADGDDDNDIDDEDGVSGWSGVQIGALGASVTVNVGGSPAVLDAWVDWNRDGVWGGPFEQIAEGVDVTTGDNVINFDVPSWADAGDSYARFRLSSAGNLGVTGYAADGEVEDYQVSINSPAPGSGVFGKHNIATDTSLNDIFAADVDGDGDMDALTAGGFYDAVVWHENDGSQNFTTTVIYSDTQDAGRAVFSADMDGDGDMDVLAALSYTLNTPRIAWYENDGLQNFTPYTITITTFSPTSVFAVDMDGDGDMDVLYGMAYYNYPNFFGGLAWAENDGDQNFTEQTIDADTHLSNVLAADMDGDGDMDVLAGGRGIITWYENNGLQNFTPYTVTTDVRTSGLFAADMDGDGDMDVLAGSRFDSTFAWYENDGEQSFSANTIDTIDIYAVFAADMDGDGDMDVLSNRYGYLNGLVILYENDGEQNFSASPPIDTIEIYEIFVADVDGDGDLDAYGISSQEGEVVWYEQLEADFGDAPAPYPTLLGENGAYHGDAAGPTLGSLRDFETDGRPTPGADGDDNHDIDDEDGVSGWIDIQTGKLGASVTVNVQGGAAKLDAWVDWNRDGAWGGPFEQIANSLDVSEGDTVITFDVPSWANAGDSYARFRLSTTGSLGVTGFASDGEVEDYQVSISSPAPSSGVFNEHLIATGINGLSSVFAADVDGDGDMDAFSGALDRISWYENGGLQNFTPYTVTTATNPNSIFATDVDGDLDMDALYASDGGLAWAENDGSQIFTKHIINDYDSFSDVFTADVDGNGRLDAISYSEFSGQGRIYWYRNFVSSEYITTASNLHSAIAADMDGDGDMDLLFGSDGGFAWVEQIFIPYRSFSKHLIVGGAAYQSVFATDMDGDGDMDALSASSDNTVAWYENDGSQNFTPYPITITTNPNSVFAADVDGDGDMDAIYGSDEELGWCENDGLQNFTIHSIATGDAVEVFAADMDGDADLDLLAAYYGSGEFAWYEQNTPPVADAGSDQSVGTEAAVTLDGSGSADPDGDYPLTYLWTQTSGPAVALSDPTIISPTFTTPSDSAVLVFTLAVTDSLGTADPTPDEVLIAVDNQFPVADAGSDQDVDANTSVQLNGSGSSDPDGDYPLTYLWTQTGGPAVTLSDPAVISPTFTTPSYSGLLTFTLVVTDSLGLPDLTPDEVVISVTNQAPVGVDDDGSLFTTDEDTPFTTGNVLDNDSDPNGSPLSVSDYDDSAMLGALTDNGDGTFGYDPDGQFEALAAGEQALEVFQYTLSDGDLTDTATVTITITGVWDGYWIYLPLIIKP